MIIFNVNKPIQADNMERIGLDSRCNNALHAIKYIYVIKQNCK